LAYTEEETMEMADSKSSSAVPTATFNQYACGLVSKPARSATVSVKPCR